MPNYKKIAIIAGLVVAGGLVAAYGVGRWRSSRQTVPEERSAIQKADDLSRAAHARINEWLKQDSDLDGLTNDEEQRLRTNPALPDTDGDGILDRDEVKLYHTDPLKADTDGDGVSDGAEVGKGTNPLRS